jgi:hypothetical protein
LGFRKITRLSLRSNQFMFTLSLKSKSKECRMSGSFPWVCICIPEGGHFSFLDADADPGMTGLALNILYQQNVRRSHPTLYRHRQSSIFFARTSTKWKSTLRASPLLCCTRSYKYLSWVKSGNHVGKYVKRTPTLCRIHIGLRTVSGLSTSPNRLSPFLPPQNSQQT